jgi:O-acetylserine/cysteine efflux transporter
MSKSDILPLIVVLLIWGIDPHIAKYATDKIPVILLLSLRFFFCALIMIPFTHKINSQQFKDLIILSILTVTNYILIFFGIKHVGASITILIIEIPFSVIFSYYIFKEKITRESIIGIIISFFGLYFLIKHQTGSTGISVSYFYILFPFIASVLGGAKFNMIKYIEINHNLKTKTILAWSTLLSFPMFILTSLLLEENQITHIQTADIYTWGSILFLSVFSFLIASDLWFNIIVKNEIHKVAPFGKLIPFITFVTAIVFLGKEFSSIQIAGGILIIFGLIVTEHHRSKKHKTKYIKHHH